MSNVWMLLCLATTCYVYTMFCGVGCSMQNNSYSYSVLAFIFSVVAGSVCVLSFSKCIGCNRILLYIGRNSLIILCFHMFVLMGISFIIKKLVHTDLLALLICLVVTSVITISITPIIKKILYFVLK